MPRELLDARHDLSEQEPCQVTFGELQSEVPGMSDEASDPTQRHPNVEGHLLSWLKVGLQVAHCARHAIHPGPRPGPRGLATLIDHVPSPARTDWLTQTAS
jgi:hypothetical protein